jgi:spore germination cell wall hydrolase CwlJ-like protein
MPSNRVLLIIGCSLLTALLIRNEVRMDMLEDQVDGIHQIIQTKERLKYTSADLDCLTKNIYYEAGVEDRTGKIAVASVTVNRLKSGYWGKTLCRVVYSPKQFSWTLFKKLSKPNPEMWDQSRQVAYDVLNGARLSGLTKSLFYHAIYIQDPRWADPTQEIGQIGNHVFYNGARDSNVRI